MIEYILIKTTFNNEEKAKKLAKILVENKLSACVQISKILSFYSWNDEIQEDNEFLLEIKAKKSNFTKIEEIIINNHDYDVPEIISVKIDEISQKYRLFLEN